MAEENPFSVFSNIMGIAQREVQESKQSPSPCQLPLPFRPSFDQPDLSPVASSVRSLPQASTPVSSPSKRSLRKSSHRHSPRQSTPSSLNFTPPEDGSPRNRSERASVLKLIRGNRIPSSVSVDSGSFESLTGASGTPPNSSVAELHSDLSHTASASSIIPPLAMARSRKSPTDFPYPVSKSIKSVGSFTPFNKVKTPRKKSITPREKSSAPLKSKPSVGYSSIIDRQINQIKDISHDLTGSGSFEHPSSLGDVLPSSTEIPSAFFSTSDAGESVLTAATLEGLLPYLAATPTSEATRNFLRAHVWLGVSHLDFLRVILVRPFFLEHLSAVILILMTFFRGKSVLADFDSVVYAHTHLRKLSSAVPADRAPELQPLLALISTFLTMNPANDPLAGSAAIAVDNPALDLVARSSSKVLAQEIASIEAGILGALSFNELFAYVYRLPSVSTRSVTRLISSTNNIMNQLAFLVLKTRTMKSRVDLVGKLIRIANRSFKMGNFSAVMMVVGVLNFSPVSRLKETFRALSGADRSAFANLDSFVSPNNNFSNYRLEIQHRMNSEKPLIPFFGILLKDLTIIEATIPTTYPGLTPEHLNISRLSIVGKHLGMLEYAQRFAPKFILTTPGDYRSLFNTSSSHSEEFLFDLSYRLEPPKAAGISLSCSLMNFSSLDPSKHPVD